jgi:hypothetical protein
MHQLLLKRRRGRQLHTRVETQAVMHEEAQTISAIRDVHDEGDDETNEFVRSMSKRSSVSVA